jgi:hypothetical protein
MRRRTPAIGDHGTLSRLAYDLEAVAPEKAERVKSWAFDHPGDLPAAETAQMLRSLTFFRGDSSGDQPLMAAVDHFTVIDGEYTRAELTEAFDLVANPENWKYPIDAVVKDDPDLIRAIGRAVPFFTGSTIEVLRAGRGKLKRIVAAGYYSAVGA